MVRNTGPARCARSVHALADAHHTTPVPDAELPSSHGVVRQYIPAPMDPSRKTLGVGALTLEKSTTPTGDSQKVDAVAGPHTERSHPLGVGRSHRQSCKAMNFVSRNSSSPSAEPSRPRPDFLTPPNGAAE